jgi:fibronectin-binding autotransporter adhesin
MTFGLLSYLGGRVPITGSLNISVPSAPDQSNNYMTISTSGATETTSGDYKIIAFYGSGTMNVRSLGIDSVSGSTVEIMMVAGGGGGGRDMGGGGGAGGYYACTTFKVFQTEYTITVGSGGAGAITDGTNPQDARGANRPGSNGSSSLITSPYGTLEAIGGGGGASRHDSESNKAGSGGSGGGASGQYGNHGRALRGDMGFPGRTSGGQWYPGGGGGAGSQGMHGNETALAAGPGNTNANAPNGGKGVQNSILGPAYWWCGGGGGGGHSHYGGNGGSGGGGAGAPSNIATNFGVGGKSGINNGADAQAAPVGQGAGYSGGHAGQYTGGGGGGTSHLTNGATNAASTVSGNGGSGVVVIKYKFQ